MINNTAYLIKPEAILIATDEAANESTSIDTAGYNSVLLSIAWKSTLAAAETMSFYVEYAGSDDDSSFDSYADLQADTVVFTDSGSGGTVTRTSNLIVNVANYKQYLKFRVTATTSSGTSNVDYSVTAIKTDGQDVPEVISFTS